MNSLPAFLKQGEDPRPIAPPISSRTVEIAARRLAAQPIGEPARAAILVALVDGRARPAGERAVRLTLPRVREFEQQLGITIASTRQ
jgi:hypothetical protein